jgi:cell division initiation protein
MRLTPLDLQNHRFSHRLRGYDPAEVDDFVKIVGEDYESLVRENEAMRESIRGLELRVAELSGQEGRLRETLVTAQTLTEDLKRTAILEAEMKVGEAEVRAEKILDAAHRRAAKLHEEIRELRLLRSRVAAAMRATLETHTAMLDGLTTEIAEEVPGTLPGWQPVPISSRPTRTAVSLAPDPA